MERFRRDNLWMGMILGLVIPVLLFALLWGIVFLVEKFSGEIPLITNQKILLLSIVPNLFLLRYYLIKLKYDLTGRGILAITFLLAIVFVILEFKA